LSTAERVVLVLEGIGDDKVLVNSSSLHHPLVVLPDQAIEIVAIEKILWGVGVRASVDTQSTFAFHSRRLRLPM
jgi:hypothetical protein